MIFSVMQKCPQHKFLILTKRPALMRHILGNAVWWAGTDWDALKHIWLGVTAENQLRADERIPVLMDIDAAVRFVSIEPMLRPVDLEPHFPIEIKPDLSCPRHEIELVTTIREPGINWAICGAETGPGACPMNLDWARDLRDQCVTAGVPFFFKRDSIGGRLLDGREWNEMPGGVRA